jgi:DNA polymerase I
MFLLDSDYKTFNEKAYVRLILKNDSKTEAFYRDFEPYIWAVCDEGEIESKKKLIEEIQKEVQGKYLTIKNCTVEDRYLFGNKIPAIKIIFNHPSDVPNLRKEIEDVTDIYEYDIPFARRFLIDKNLVPAIHYNFEIEKEEDHPLIKYFQITENLNLSIKVLAFDIEVYCKAKPDAQSDPIIMIGISTNDFDKVITYKKVVADYIEIVDNETLMLIKFLDIILEYNPDIIYTYNGDTFDFPYIYERAKKLKINHPILNEIKIDKRGINDSSKIPGMVHIDLYPLSRKLLSLNKYTLENVYLNFLGKEKSKIQLAEMDKFWEEGTQEGLITVALYNMEDAIAAKEIGAAIGPLEIELSRIVGQNIFDISRMASSNMVEYLLMKRAFEEKTIVPNKPKGSEYLERSSYTYEGGFVLDPQKGLHEHIAVFDFRSLYPSIIIAHNIDPNTIGCDCCDNTSPEGVNFCLNKKGFIPEILKELIERRVEIKRKLKEASGKNEKTIYQSQQWALKILANSFYGYMGYPRSRWYSKEAASSIASWGREYIHKAIKIADEMGLKVLYGDTDSLFVGLGSEDLEKSKEFRDKVNSTLPDFMELEFEGYYRRGFFVSKKRYAIIDKENNIVTKGLEVVRRDWAEIAKKTQEAVLKTILEGEGPEKAAEIVRKTTQELVEGKIPVDSLIIYTQLTMPISSYKQIGPHVIVAKRMKEMGEDVRAGTMISFIVKSGEGMIRDRSYDVESFKKAGYKYDAEYYMDNQVLPAVMRILKGFGYTEESLKFSKNKQMTLGDYF